MSNRLSCTRIEYTLHITDVTHYNTNVVIKNQVASNDPEQRGRCARTVTVVQIHKVKR